MLQDYYSKWKAKYGDIPQIPEPSNQLDCYSMWKQRYGEVPQPLQVPERITWQKEFLPALGETLKETISENLKFIDMPKIKGELEKAKARLLPQPSKVGLKEVLAEVPGVLKMRPIGKLFEEGYWKDVPKKLLSGAKDFVTEMFYAIVPMSGPERKRFASYMPLVEEPTPLKILKAGVAPPVGMATFLPRAAINLAKDPAKMIQEDPFSIVMLIAAIGTPAARRFKTKLKQGTATGLDIQKVVKTVPNKIISAETKTAIIEGTPPDWVVSVYKQTYGEGIKPPTIKKPIPKVKKPTVKAVEAMPHAREAVSVEALSRLKTQSFHLYDARTKTLKPLIGVDAIDIMPKPYEAKVILNKKTGSIDYIDYGKNLTTAARPLIEQQVFKMKGVETIDYKVKQLAKEAVSPEEFSDLLGEQINLKKVIDDWHGGSNPEYVTYQGKALGNVMNKVGREGILKLSNEKFAQLLDIEMHNVAQVIKGEGFGYHKPKPMYAGELRDVMRFEKEFPLENFGKIKSLWEKQKIAAFEKAGKVEKLEYAPGRETPLAEAIEKTAATLGIKRVKAVKKKAVKPLTQEEISAVSREALPPEVAERMKKAEKAPDWSEYYSGYPFIKEFTESMRKLTKGELTGITKNIPAELPTAKPQIITKKLPKIEIKPYSIPTKEPLRVVKRIRKGAMPIYKHELDALLKIEDLPPRKVKRFYENPIRVIEEYPTIKKLIYDPIKIAEDAIVRDFDIVKKNSWKMKMSARKNPTRLGVYSISKQVNGAEILKRMKKKVEQPTPEELRNYKTVRAGLENIYILMNETRRLAGRKPMPKVKNYFTFARNLETLKQLGHDPIFERDMGVLRKHLNAPPFKYAIKRKKVLAPVELDFYEVYKNYMHSALRFIHKAPIIAKGRTMIGDYAFEVGGKKTNWSFKAENPRLHTYLTQWLDRQAGQIPPSIAPQLLHKAASTLSRNIGMAVLTFNVRSALIQWSALRNAYIELGIKYLTRGLIDNYRPELRKFAREKIPGIRSRKMDIHIEEMLTNPVRKKLGKIKRRVGKVGIAPLQFFDIEAARATGLGAYKRGIAPRKKGGLGLSQKEARVYATDTVTRTQASAQPSDIAPVQATAFGKLGTIFQTFVINEWNFLSKDVMGWKNPKMVTRERVTKVARLVVGTALVNALYEGVFKIRSPYPAPEWAIKHALEKEQDWKQIMGAVAKEMGEQLPFIGGTIRWSTPYRLAWPAALQVAEGTGKLIDKIVHAKTEFTRRDIETVAKLLGVPATSQVAKYLSRRKQGMSHVEAVLGVRTDIMEKKKKGYTER